MAVSLSTMVATVTLQIPDRIYQRLVNTAHATKRPLEEVILHALEVGSPPVKATTPPRCSSGC